MTSSSLTMTMQAPALANMAASMSLTLMVQKPELKSLKDWHAAFDRLAEISINFEELNDETSVKLFAWTAKILKVDLPQEAEMEEFKAWTESGREAINELALDILINPLDRAPLKEPMLGSDGWVWEKWILDDYQTFSKTSPFDGKALSAKVHQFAQEMLAWMESVKSLIGDTASTSCISADVASSTTAPRYLDRAILGNNTANNPLKFFNYYNRAQNAILLKKIKHQAEIIKQAAVDTALFKEEIRKASKKDIEAASLKLKEQEQKIGERIESMAENNKKTTDSLHAQIQGVKQLCDESEQKRAEVEKTCASQSAQIQAIRAAYARQAQEVAALHQQANKKRRGCTIC